MSAKCLWLLSIALVLSACASQTATSSTVERGGCQVDLKRVCEAYFSQPSFYLNGEAYDAGKLQQNRRMHELIVLPFTYPDGGLIATVGCQIDTGHMSVTAARLLEGPPLTDKAIEYVRSRGLCSATTSDYQEVIKQEEERVLGAGNR